jgi:hypothetical protein
MSREQYRTDRTFLVDLVSTLKELRKRIAAVREEEKLWTGRLELVEQNRRADLQEAAVSRLRESRSLLTALEDEERELLSEIRTARGRYEKSRAAREIESDPEQLLRELEGLIGNTDV